MNLDSLPTTTNSLQGNIAFGNGYSSDSPSKDVLLTEPIKDTIIRDLVKIRNKIKYVLMPFHMASDNCESLKNWDLWGPLIICLSLAITLSFQSSKESDSIFGMIFILVWIGATVITLNARLLKGQVSFFQSICILGYSVFPICLNAIILSILGLIVGKQYHIFTIIKLILSGIAFSWATYASSGFMASIVQQHKKWLVVYPICLFYLTLTWYTIFI